jgi:DeoR/GlpR family transcriptional regulator of sugar metabolism
MKDSIYTPERLNQIIELLSQQGKLTVSEIVEHFSVSEATARRDLNSLASEGLIKRFYGGAILNQKAAPEEPILRRTHDQEEEKERIGKMAAAQIQNEETIFLGSGTTVLQVAKNLADLTLTVITNSLPIINLMADWPNITLIALGGQFRASERSFIGHITEKSLQDLRADKVIIGIRAVSMEHGLTNDYLAETLTDRNILQMGQKVMVVADHTKFGRVSTVFVAPVEKVNTFVTDSQASKEFIEYFKSHNVDVILV